MNCRPQNRPRLAFVSILLLCIATVAASLYVVLLVHWAPYSVFLPLAGTVLILGGTLGVKGMAGRCGLGMRS